MTDGNADAYANSVLYTRTVPANRAFIAGIFMTNSELFWGTIHAKSNSFARTLPTNSYYAYAQKEQPLSPSDI